MDATWPIHRLASLRKLRLRYSTLEPAVEDPVELPASLWQLPELRSLELFRVNARSLPDNIPPTAKLQSLSIDQSWLTSLPDTIGRLSDLTSLIVICAKLQQLPDQLAQLSSLRVLELKDCMADRVVRSPRLSGLTTLEHIHFTPLTALSPSSTTWAHWLDSRTSNR
jgi:Leucine-rich repeat (LRR) protein